MTFREWPLTCGEHNTKQLLWDYQLTDATCTTCNAPAHIVQAQSGQSAGIATDDIPGGLEIKHGLCNEDGTPRKFYSKTDMKRAANERGYTIAGDTPKPYRVHWSGKQSRVDGIKNN